MDSPVVTQLFRQLFRSPHPACLARRNLTNLATALHRGRQLTSGSVRALSSSRGVVNTSEKERAWNRRSDVLTSEKVDEASKFPMVTARDLRGYKERPKRVKMLMRDFVEGQ